ncbi:transposase, partial [Sphaerotilus montanus]
CIVHLLRNSLSFAGWKERKLLAAALRPIYTAVSAEAALAELEAFERGPWGQKFPMIGPAWRCAWERVTPFFAYPPAVKRLIYTTNAIESLKGTSRNRPCSPEPGLSLHKSSSDEQWMTAASRCPRRRGTPRRG